MALAIPNACNSFINSRDIVKSRELHHSAKQLVVIRKRLRSKEEVMFIEEFCGEYYFLKKKKFIDEYFIIRCLLLKAEGKQIIILSAS